MRAAGVDQPLDQTAPPPRRIIAWFCRAPPRTGAVTVDCHHSAKCSERPNRPTNTCERNESDHRPNATANNRHSASIQSCPIAFDSCHDPALPKRAEKPSRSRLDQQNGMTAHQVLRRSMSHCVRTPVGTQSDPPSVSRAHRQIARIINRQNGGDMRAAGVREPLGQNAPPPLRIIAWLCRPLQCTEPADNQRLL